MTLLQLLCAPKAHPFNIQTALIDADYRKQGRQGVDCLWFNNIKIMNASWIDKHLKKLSARNTSKETIYNSQNNYPFTK